MGYNFNIMEQSICLVIYPITVDSFAALFNFTPVDRASDSMIVRMGNGGRSMKISDNQKRSNRANFVIFTLISSQKALYH